MTFSLDPIALVHNERRTATDDFWGNVVSRIELDPQQFTPDALAGLDQFSHLEIAYLFHLVQEVQTGSNHPRENPAWPKVGIFAQRKKNRPNRLGISVCKLLKVERMTLTVQALDAIDGTPVVDIKPYIREFAPDLQTVRQPAWASELMVDYFK